MKRKTPVLCLLAAALVSLALLAGCGAKAQPVHITVVNRTTLPLADLRIKLVSEEDFGENRLETTLQEGETASIQLGQYTQAQLDGGCNLQFYDETGEPVYPEYDPDTVTLVESGNVFILAPPNLSVTLFVDSSYDPAAYDEKIAALYDLADDGRGDVIPQGGGFHEDAVNDFTAFAGIWLGEANNDYDSMEIDADGSWTLYLCGEAVDSGSLRYEPEWEAVYAYSDLDDSGSRIALEGSQLYTAAYGYFNSGEGMEYLWYAPGSLAESSEASGSYWSWDSSLFQRNVAEFEGVWYYEGDLSAETYIVLDGHGSWSYYQRAPGAESEEMDCGTFSYSTDEASTYYADSTLYDGVSYKVFELDEDVLVWGDEGSYYLME